MRKYRVWCLAVGALLLTAAASVRADVLFGATGTGGGTGTLGTIDPATGAFTPIGAINDALGNNFRVTGLAFHPVTGVLYGAANQNSPTARNSLIRIDPATALATVIGAYRQGGQGATDLTFGPGGTLYGWFEPAVDGLYTIDPATGAATPMGASGILTFGSGLASSAAGILLLAHGNGGFLHTLDPTTGAAAPGIALTGSPVLDGAFPALAFDSAGTLFGLNIDNDGTGNPAFLVTIDPATGAVTNRGRTPNRLDAIAFQITPAAVIPEPSSLALCAAGALSLPGLIRRRKNSGGGG